MKKTLASVGFVLFFCLLFVGDNLPLLLSNRYDFYYIWYCIRTLFFLSIFFSLRPKSCNIYVLSLSFILTIILFELINNLGLNINNFAKHIIGGMRIICLIFSVIICVTVFIVEKLHKNEAKVINKLKTYANTDKNIFIFIMLVLFFNRIFVNSPKIAVYSYNNVILIYLLTGIYIFGFFKFIDKSYYLFVLPICFAFLTVYYFLMPFWGHLFYATFYYLPFFVLTLVIARRMSRLINVNAANKEDTALPPD